MKPLGNLNQTLKRIFIPTPLQVFVSLGVAVAIMVIAYRNLLVALAAQGSYVPESDISQTLNDQLVQLSSLPFIEKLSVGLFWAAVACVAYIGYIAVSNVLISMRNNYVIDTQFLNEEGSWRHRAHSLVVKAGWLVLLLGTVVLTLTVLLPLWLSMFGDPLLVGAELPIIYVPLGLLGLTVNVYVVWMLILAIKYSE
ncbi:hypothetical protein EPO04_04000 [Patescibacteria group bacterium]|nr:MAG: hypothetical protein EPO04_04000 [Patescibacteria group bacterium]